MKKITSFVLFLVATCTGLVAQVQNKPAQTLFDFRVIRTAGPPRISLQTERAIVSRVFRKYLTDQSQCSRQFDATGSNDRLQAARSAGQIVPSILDSATGSFTAPGQTQTLYVISVSECNASHADNFGTKRVAIFSGQRLISDIDVDFKSSILRKTDLDGDGVHELLMSTGYTNQGTVIETAALVDFHNGRMRLIDDFGTVYEDPCASLVPGSSATASVILIGAAGPGEMPKLKLDNYRASCRNVKRWRYVSSGKM